MYIWAIVNRRLLPVFVSTVLITSFTIFTVMNFILFWRVLSSERRIMREAHSLKSKDKMISNGLHNTNYSDDVKILFEKPWKLAAEKPTRMSLVHPPRFQLTPILYVTYVMKSH
ncbi:hypothetical protein X801_10355, partial [Opisthorchis viverrini]